jgi:hypothetical protein
MYRPSLTRWTTASTVWKPSLVALTPTSATTLETLILEIQPIVVYRPGKGILEPNSLYFPRHAKHFYALRDPRTTRHFDTLAYLAKFYDVHLPLSSEATSDESTDEEPTIPRPDLVVEILEQILGLDEERFSRFAERAKEHTDLHPDSQAITAPSRRS